MSAFRSIKILVKEQQEAAGLPEPKNRFSQNFSGEKRDFYPKPLWPRINPTLVRF